MADLLARALKHRYIYVPRDTQEDTLGPGMLLGLRVARERRARLTVLAVRKDGATHRPELAKQTIVTERSGHISDGGVVLAWCPRHKTMEKLQHLENSVVVLVEWIPGEMEGWAKLNMAYNVVTDEIMDADLSEQATEILDRIVFEGYKGWTDSIAQRMVRSFLDDLVALGAYDRGLVLAYARESQHEASIERLKKILDNFDVSVGAESTKPRRWEL